jgi:hypothetical protein
MTVNVGRDGGVISSPHHFVRNLGAEASGSVQLGAVASAETAADELGLEPTKQIRILQGSAGPARELVLSDGGIAESPIPARLVYQALRGGEVRLAWHLTYNAATDAYTYVWKTNASWAGTCRQLTIEFAEGYEYTAFLSFT